MPPNSPLARKLIEDGLKAKPAPEPERFDHLADARREASCIGLDVGDAIKARVLSDRRKHISDALGRAHQLIHMLKAAQAEAAPR